MSVQQPATVAAEFVFETAPFASAHASTIVETATGWSRPGLAERVKARPTSASGCRDTSRARGRRRSRSRPASSRTAGGTPAGIRCCSTCRDKALMLFYKVGPSPQTWWGMVRTSRDSGRTWTDARRLPDGILGPIKNKPVRLADGTLVAASSTETPARPSAWRVHFERSTDAGLTWTAASRRRLPMAARSTRSSPASLFIRAASSRPSDARGPGASSRPGPATADERGRRCR